VCKTDTFNYLVCSLRLHTAYVSFLAWAAKRSLEAITYIDIIKPMIKFQRAVMKLIILFEKVVMASLICGIIVLFMNESICDEYWVIHE
jgi:hypothetical protein